MFKFFSKKHILFLADRISSGNFSVFLPLALQENTHTVRKETHKLSYHIVIAIIILTLVVHTWAFFERHVLKNALAPIALVVSGFLYEKAFAASPPSASPAAKQPPPQTNPKQNKGKQADTDADKTSHETFDPLSLDESRIKILLSLYDREKELKAREDKLATKENIAKAIEVQVQKKTAELAELKGVIESLSKSYNDAINKNMKNLVNIYETMKPQVAAKFFDELPLDVLTPLIKAMNPKKTSAIFTFMNVDKVKSITDRFAFMPEVPEKK